ncbi:MAG: epoxyqueuosine reductase, partial [Candidatus Sumerlaeia bacterium]
MDKAINLKEEIGRLARKEGAALCGIALVERYEDYLRETTARLDETGATGRAYMLGQDDAHGFFEKLADVRAALPWARSIVLLGVYALDRNSDYRNTRQELRGKTARTYAYYPVVRQIAERVAAYLQESGCQAVHGQQIPLKHVASRIGLGVYGWNGILLTKRFGSYVALRAVLTDAMLEPDHFDPPLFDCKTCGRCVKACPTGALFAPYKVDPARCINPLTRTNGELPPELRRKM